MGAFYSRFIWFLSEKYSGSYWRFDYPNGDSLVVNR